MVKYVKQLSLEVTAQYPLPVVFAKQLDKASRFVEITMYKLGERLIPTVDAAAKFRAIKPDGTGIFNPAIITENNTILVELTEQTLAVAGDVKADVMLLGEHEEVLSTVNFLIKVVPVPLGELKDSTNEFIVLIDLYERVEEILREIEHIITFDGYIDDLLQRDPVIFYCGTASEVVEEAV